jgi:ubiquinone/menaquinone biosynthesis C-methylase UbiE
VSKPRALSFGNAAEHYERGRPVWPVEAVKAAGVPVASHVLDLGAGTGKLTRVLAERFSRVTAVEPDDAMRALNRWGDVLAGSATNIPLADASVDAVFVAEAFHWFGDEPALAEIARVLRPGGTLALMWTQREGRVTPTAEALDEFWERIRPGDPPGRMEPGVWRAAFESAPFAALEETIVPFTHRLGCEAYISFLLSQSTIAARSPSERLELAAELERIVPEAAYDIPMRAEVHVARRL